MEVKRKLFYWLDISNFLYIIVLLILAGITINAIFGSDSVLNKATQAKEENDHATVKEQINLELVNYELAKGTGEADGTSVKYLADKKYFTEAYNAETTSYVINHDKINGVSLGKGTSKDTGNVYVIEKESIVVGKNGKEITSIGKVASVQKSDVINSVQMLEEDNQIQLIGEDENTIKVAEAESNTDNKWALRYYKTSSEVKDLMTFSTLGKLSNNEETKTIGELVNDGELKVGNFVNYVPSGLGTGKTYTSPENKNGYKDQTIEQENLPWQVLAIDDQKITLIAEPTYRALTLQGPVGWLNAESEINKVCEELYSSEYGKARSINIDDIEKNVGCTFDTYQVTTTDEIYYPDENGTEIYNGITNLSKGIYTSPIQKNISYGKIKDSASQQMLKILFETRDDYTHNGYYENVDGESGIDETYWISSKYAIENKWDSTIISFNIPIGGCGIDRYDYLLKYSEINKIIEGRQKFQPLRPIVEISLDQRIPNIIINNKDVSLHKEEKIKIARKLQEQGYSVGITKDDVLLKDITEDGITKYGIAKSGHILAADTQDDKVILYEYDGDGSLLSTREVQYTNPNIFEFDKTTGAITGIKSTQESGQLGYYEKDVGIHMGNLTELVIPKEIEGVEVKSICFSKTKKYQNWESRDIYTLIGISKVIIPNTVEKIDSAAFYESNDIEVITLPNSLENIEAEALNYCCNLNALVIPSSVTSIGTRAFNANMNLTAVYIPSSVKSIGEYAFDTLKADSTIYIESEDLRSLLSGKYDESKTTVELLPSGTP